MTVPEGRADPKPGSGISDSDILALFGSQPERAWDFFVARYSDVICSYLRHLGFDYDEAMDRFVYVCEKLCEGNFRRFKTIRYTGRDGELTPWLRKVVKNLCINWAWSVEGRRRLVKPVARLSPLDQRIFELYFWKGLSPGAIHEQLRLAEQREVEYIDVVDSLERIFARLSGKRLWRLLSRLSRTQGELPLDEGCAEARAALDPPDERANPEESAIQRETQDRVGAAMARLPARERLVLQFRYEDGLAMKEIGELLHVPEHHVKRSLKTALGNLRKEFAVKPGASFSVGKW